MTLKRTLTVVFAASVLMLSIPVLQADTATFQDGVGGYTGTEDALLLNQSGYRDRNWGAYGEAVMRNTSHNLLRFDITSLGSVSNLDITGAEIELSYQSDSIGTGSMVVYMYEILPANAGWVEGRGVGLDVVSGESTWNNRQHSSTAWAGSAGCSTAGTDYNGTAVGTVTLTDNGANAIFTITNAAMLNTLEDWADGTATNAGFVIFTSSTSRVSFDTTDTSGGTAPKMTITYTPEPATMALLALGLPLALRRKRRA
ncbi:MAG: PEP-CTERM sorting domain-containing protein [Phycisphaerae bacterium]|nr:PEP-CTERM sorting domain-containing protein [Phycisphaerae bacterium]